MNCPIFVKMNHFVVCSAGTYPECAGGGVLEGGAGGGVLEGGAGGGVLRS